MKTAVFGGGCFWCTEAVFHRLKGVASVMPGYAGGTKENPTYDDVCAGNTGHAEVVKIEFEPSQISYRDLLMVFFATHNNPYCQVVIDPKIAKLKERFHQLPA